MDDSRPFKTCLCAPSQPCVACPLIHSCPGCRATVAQRCRRPSGHTGNFVMTHEPRLLLSDVDAIAKDPGEVRARLLTQREEGGQAIVVWLRSLRGLQAAAPRLWEGRVDAATIDGLVALARDGERAGVQTELQIAREDGA